MRISDWSSDVCSSDLSQRRLIRLSRAVIGIQSNERRRRVIVHRGTEGGDAEPATLACEVREKARSEEHTSELQSLMRISYAVFCLKKKKKNNETYNNIFKQQQERHNTVYIQI